MTRLCGKIRIRQIRRCFPLPFRRPWPGRFAPMQLAASIPKRLALAGRSSSRLGPASFVRSRCIPCAPVCCHNLCHGFTVIFGPSPAQVICNSFPPLLAAEGVRYRSEPLVHCSPPALSSSQNTSRQSLAMSVAQSGKAAFQFHDGSTPHRRGLGCWLPKLA